MNSKTSLQTGRFFTSNSYWGRGILIGMTGKGRIAVAYFIMGRSQNSRNRYFFEEGDNVVIAPHDLSKVEDPSLIIYYPVRRNGDCLIVTNGDQTDTVDEYLTKGLTFEDALRTRRFEPDAPNFTPRISGMVDLKTGDFKLSILKNIDGKGELCGRNFFEYAPIPGEGRFLHTYERNENPLPTFEGEPWRVAVEDDLDAFTQRIWNDLDEENKISLVTMQIDPADGAIERRILNRRLGD
ncbi:MAG: IMP cyclohydrolase [Mogibacterium sp.]|nr:IMP cyclohydrolase [Mogibacterium sp.]